MTEKSNKDVETRIGKEPKPTETKEAKETKKEKPLLLKLYEKHYLLSLQNVPADWYNISFSPESKGPEEVEKNQEEEETKIKLIIMENEILNLQILETFYTMNEKDIQNLSLEAATKGMKLLMKGDQLLIGELENLEKKQSKQPALENALAIVNVNKERETVGKKIEMLKEVIFQHLGGERVRAFAKDWSEKDWEGFISSVEKDLSENPNQLKKTIEEILNYLIQKEETKRGT